MDKIESLPVACVGALNLDMSGIPAEAFRPQDSNPGRVEIGAGGVGHNIARHLAQAGVAVELLAIVGDDASGMLLRTACAREGVGLAHAFSLPGASSCYLCIHDETGRLVGAVNDMSLLDEMTPTLLAQRLPVLSGAPLILADTNPPGETLRWLSSAVTTPILLDPVSTFKAERIRDFVGQFAAIKPNRLEATSLSGEEDPARAAQWFLEKGVGMVFISLGEEGVYYAGQDACGHLPATPMRVKNTNGAGDAMAAGIALGMLQNLSTKACAALGLQTVAGHLYRQGGMPL